MVSIVHVMILLCIVAVSCNILVYGSRSEEDNQRGEILDERQILKPLVKPVMIKRNNIMQPKGYSNTKSNRPVKYVSIPVEEGSRSEYSRTAFYSKTRGGNMPLYQVRTFPKSLNHPTRPKVVYVVQPRHSEQLPQVLYHENSLYPEVLSNYISDVSPNRTPIGYKYLQRPFGNEEVIGSYSQYGGVEYSPQQELLSPYVYREPIGKENKLIIYSDGPVNSVGTLTELTGSELHPYTKYEYRTVNK